MPREKMAVYIKSLFDVKILLRREHISRCLLEGSGKSKYIFSRARIRTRNAVIDVWVCIEDADTLE